MKHKDARLGAALAYYSIFSLGPIVMIAITIAGLFFGEEIVRSQVGELIKGLMGETGAQAVNTMLTGANSDADKGIVPTLIGVGALIFAAVGVVVQLKDALNTVWEVEDTKASGDLELHPHLHPVHRSRDRGRVSAAGLAVADRGDLRDGKVFLAHCARSAVAADRVCSAPS